MYSVEQRYQRLWQQLLIGSCSLVGLCFCGTAWYVLIEKWSVSDAAYMTMITISTVGFGEVRQLDSDRLRLITVTLIVLGVINIGYIVNRFTEAMIGGDVRAYRKLKEQQQIIDRLQNHYNAAGRS